MSRGTGRKRGGERLAQGRENGGSLGVRMRSAPPLLAVALALAFSTTGCRTRTALCERGSDCGSARTCVAGRCHPLPPPPGAPTTSAQPEALVNRATRVVLQPLDRETYGAGAGGELSLGRDGALLVRFGVPQGLRGHVVEAYVVLHRTRRPTDSSVSLHAGRFSSSPDRWPSNKSASPRPEGAAGATTHVDRQSPSLVRVDVHTLVDEAILASVQKTVKNAEENKRSVVVTDDLVVAVAGACDDPDGEGMAFAASSSDGPFLEIYWRE